MMLEGNRLSREVDYGLCEMYTTDDKEALQVSGGVRSIILRERRICKTVVALGTHEEQNHAGLLSF